MHLKAATCILLPLAARGQGSPLGSCTDADFPDDLAGKQYLGLSKAGGTDVASCRQSCCDAGSSCQIYQWDAKGGTGCWVGQARNYVADNKQEFVSRGRNLPPPTPQPTPAPPPQGPYTLDDTPGLGLRWEGVGAISGGGATSKLLMDYEEGVVGDILDFMFLPNFGLNLQMLKVEVGGDTDATEGAEPSHMHYKGDENYERGYEWWLMKEAKKRNPDIKLYGLPWGWPGWLDPDATASRPATNPFAQPAVTANYTLNWLLGAQSQHQLDIDYIGQWNERDAPTPYARALRQAVYGSQELGNRTFVLDRLPHYPGTTDDMDPRGCTQYTWNTSDGSRWVDEEGSIFDGRSARCLARCLNRNYISGCHTATFQWHLISSFYDFLPWSRCGVAVANTPWSGHYQITSPTWALAHTSQFAPVGWRYAAHGSGTTTLEKGGSLVTRISPTLQDFSIVMEKMSSANSACARGSNPPDHMQAENVTVYLKGSFLKAARAKGYQLRLWSSDMNSGNGEGVNPPEDKVFQASPDIQVDPSTGAFTILLQPEHMHTVTTLTSGNKGSHPVPPATPFPLPYTQDFDAETIHAPPALWYDQMGAWEVQADPYSAAAAANNSHPASNLHSQYPVKGPLTGALSGGNQVMRQVSPIWPACWGYSCDGPTTYFGPQQFNSSTSISLRVYLESDAEFHVGASINSNFAVSLKVSSNGTWVFQGRKGSAPGCFSVGAWHNVSVQIGDGWQAAVVGAKTLANVTDKSPEMWSVKVAMNKYVFAAIDDFKIATF